MLRCLFLLLSIGSVVALSACGSTSNPAAETSEDSQNTGDEVLGIAEPVTTNSATDPANAKNPDDEVDAAALIADERRWAQTEPNYVEAVLEDLDLTSDELTQGVVAAGLGLDPTDPQVVSTIVDLGTALSIVTDEATPVTQDAASELLASALARRASALGIDASSSQADLIDAVLAEIGLDGGSLDPASTQEQILAFLNDNRVNIMRLAPQIQGVASQLLSDSGYDNAKGSLQVLALTGDVIALPVPELEGIDGVAIDNLRWETDDATRTISFLGEAAILGTTSDFSVALQWRAAEGRPTTLVSWHTATWSLQDIGVTGPLGDIQIPQATFVVTDEPWTFTSSATPESVLAFVGEHHGQVASGFEASTGVSLLSALPIAALPDTIANYLSSPGSGGVSTLPLSGSLGNTLASLTGGGSDAPLRLSAPVGQLSSVTPTWLTIPTDDPWELSIFKEGGATVVSLGGRALATIDGATKAFDMGIDLAAIDGNAGGALEGALVDTWANPFGLTWLTLDEAALRIAGTGSTAEASLTTTTSLFGTNVDVDLALASGPDTTSAELSVVIDRISLSQALELFDDNDFLPELPTIELRDVVFTANTGQDASANLSATVAIAGNNTDIHASLVSKPDGGYGTLFGISLDSAALTDLIPAARGTVLDEIEFPGATLLFGNIDGRVERGSMSSSLQSFLDSSGARLEQLNLQSGLSLVSSLDFDKVGLGEPMAALGLADLELPIVGSLPIGALGSGGSQGDRGLDGLNLRVDLPEFVPSGGPEWIDSGQLSFFVSGAPSIGIEGRLSVTVDDTPLDFIVTAQMARETGGFSMSLTGELAAQEPWVAPFDLEWLTFNEARLTIGVAPIGSVNLGFGGRATIAGKDLEGAVLLEVSPAGVPTNFILDVASEAGLSTNDLLTVVSQMGGSRPNTAGYPSLALRNADLLFAPRGSVALEVDQGFRLAGDAFLTIAGAERRLASLDVSVDENGIEAFGRLGDGQPWELGPMIFRQVEIDLTLTRSNQAIALRGSVELFGLPFDADIDLSTRSIFLAGQEALTEIQGIVDDFEALVEDPTNALLVLPELFDRAGVEAPLWIDGLADAKAQLDKLDVERPDALDLALNGAKFPLLALPAGGVEPDNCPVLSPIPAEGRCWTTPPIPALGGLPDGGAAQRCPALAPLESGGRCYTLRPDPCDEPFEVICDPNGTPNGGVAPVCGIETPVNVSGRCYTIPPTPPVAGLPAGGEAQVCGPLAPFEEGGRCYTLTPSAASVGLEIPGVCTPFNIPCSTDQLLRGTVAELLGSGLVERFNDWAGT